MKLSEAMNLAKDLMKHYELDDWKFEFDNAVRRFGCCKFNTKTISLSEKLTLSNDLKHVEDTIRHEIAHALAGAQAGHGHVWKRKAVELGCRPSPYCSREVVSVPRAFEGTCPNGHKTQSHKRNRLSCSKCDRKFNSNYMFTWVRVATPR